MSDFKKTITAQLKDSAKVLTATAKLSPVIDAAAKDLLRSYRNGVDDGGELGCRCQHLGAVLKLRCDRFLEIRHGRAPSCRAILFFQ